MCSFSAARAKSRPFGNGKNATKMANFQFATNNGRQLSGKRCAILLLFAQEILLTESRPFADHRATNRFC